MPGNRSRALDTAIHLVGTEGIRSLTHVRIDERAGLPKGSTSNYFRTRAALLAGVVDRIVELEMSDVEPALALRSEAELVDSLCGLIELTTGPGRVMTTARLVLFMEASHDEALRVALAHGRSVMQEQTTAVLAALGATDPIAAAVAVMACCEGLILHRIARHDRTDPRPALSLMVASVLRPAA